MLWAGRSDHPLFDPHPQRRGARLRSGGDHRPRKVVTASPMASSWPATPRRPTWSRPTPADDGRARLAGDCVAGGARRRCRRARAWHAAGHRGGRRRGRPASAVGPQRAGRTVIGFERQRPTLEDVFLRVLDQPAREQPHDGPGTAARQGAAGAVATRRLVVVAVVFRGLRHRLGVPGQIRPGAGQGPGRGPVPDLVRLQPYATRPTSS